VPLLYEMAARRCTIDELIGRARERGDLDAEGWPTQEAIDRIKGATAAPLETDAGEDGEAGETVQRLHPSEDGKGCNPVKERVQPCQGKGAPVAPEPSFNHQGTPSQGARGGAREGAGDDPGKSSGRK